MAGRHQRPERQHPLCRVANSATATGIGLGSKCCSGHLTNGNEQTTRATAASTRVSGDTLAQDQSGTISGTTLNHVPYVKTYEGT
jgi:hypothetical protein